MSTADFPLTDFEVLRTSDIDTARRELGRLLSPHALRAECGTAHFDVRCHAVSLGDASVLCTQYGAAVRLEPGALETFYLVGMPVRGTSTIRCGNDEFVSHPGLASVQSCTRPIVTRWNDDCRKLSIKIERAALERRLAALVGSPPTHPVEFAPLLDLGAGAGASWQRLIAFLLAELTPGSIHLASPVSRRALGETLISTLLLVQPNNYTPLLRGEARPCGPAFVRRAEEFIVADPAAPDGLAGLASRVGVSVRSLQAGFRRHRGTTPLEFIRMQRLARARQMLEHPDAATCVTDVALYVGYTHLGRFAAHYKARYGESPSATLAGARGAG